MTDLNQIPDHWLQPSPKLRAMRLTQVATCTALVAVAAAIVAALVASLQAVTISVVVVLVLGLVTAIFVLRRVRSWFYCERSEELIVKRGLLVQRLSVIPYGRMQFVDVTAGLFERAFKLATVQLHTAAAATDARIPGLSSQEAQRLRDQLTSRGESRLSGL